MKNSHNVYLRILHVLLLNSVLKMCNRLILSKILFVLYFLLSFLSRWLFIISSWVLNPPYLIVLHSFSPFISILVSPNVIFMCLFCLQLSSFKKTESFAFFISYMFWIHLCPCGFNCQCDHWLSHK